MHRRHQSRNGLAVRSSPRWNEDRHSCLTPTPPPAAAASLPPPPPAPPSASRSAIASIARSAAASAFAAQVRFPADQVTTDGESKTYTATGENGAAHFHFCPDCGATVFFTNDSRPRHHRHSARRVRRSPCLHAQRGGIRQSQARVGRNRGRGRAVRLAAPRLAIDAQEIAAEQFLQPPHAPPAPLQIAGQPTVSVDAVIGRDQRIDARRLAR